MPYELSWRDEAGNGELCFAWTVRAGSAQRIALGLPTAHGLVYAVLNATDELAALLPSDDPLAAVKKPARIGLDPAFLPLMVLEPLPASWTRLGRFRAQRWVDHPPYVALAAADAGRFWDGLQQAPPRVPDQTALSRSLQALAALPFAQRLQVRSAAWLAARAVRKLASGATDVERVEIIHQFVHRLNAASQPGDRDPRARAALMTLLDALAAALGLPPAQGEREALPTRVTHWGDWARTF